MRILVVSDTHGHAERLVPTLKQAGKIDLLIHCGDIEGQENYIRKAAGCPCYMVAGNNDWSSRLDREITTNIDDYKVMITHGHRYGVSLGVEHLLDEARSRGASWCLFGHTHKPLIDIRQNVVLLNPGSLSYPRQIGRRPTYLLIEIDRNHEAHFSIREVKD